MCVCMCMCVCVWVRLKTRKYVAAKYSSVRLLNVCEATSTSMEILIYGKCTNFTMAMNVVLLAVCSIFPAVCPKLSSSLGLWAARWEELRMRAKTVKQRVKTWEKETVKCDIYIYIYIYIYIGFFVTWSDPNAWFIFVQDKFKMRGRSWKPWHLTLLSNQTPEAI